MSDAQHCEVEGMRLPPSSESLIPSCRRRGGTLTFESGCVQGFAPALQVNMAWLRMCCLPPGAALARP